MRGSARAAFADVVGQPAAVAALSDILDRTAGSGSTLIVGPEGVGRFLLALRAARHLLARTPADATRIDRRSHPDLLVFEKTESNLEDLHAMLGRLALLPAEADRQVLILRDADGYSRDAHNALLKTVEEAPAGAALFLIAEGIEWLPETLVSRCRIVRARALSDREVAVVLDRLGLDETGAADAEGSPGRAVFQAENGIREAAEQLLRLMTERAKDGLAAAEKLARPRGEEESEERRRRQAEILRVAAARARRKLPEAESVLRRLLDGLGSLSGNVNPAILFADLALTPWKRPKTPTP